MPSARIREHAAPALRGAGDLRKRFLAGLPFAPTHAQARVAAEVARDLGKPAPMLRLVQGDVGSGKTVVAALAALAAVESGIQAALMAPTELLAEQHYRNFQRWMEPLGIEVVWLAGKLKGRVRSAGAACSRMRARKRLRLRCWASSSLYSLISASLFG